MVKIRNATNKDITKILKLRPDLTVDKTQERLDLQDKKEAEFFILEKDGEIVSYVFLKWKGKKTHPEYPDLGDSGCVFYLSI